MNIAAELVLFRPFSGKERKPRSLVKCFFFSKKMWGMVEFLVLIIAHTGAEVKRAQSV